MAGRGISKLDGCKAFSLSVEAFEQIAERILELRAHVAGLQAADALDEADSLGQPV